MRIGAGTYQNLFLSQEKERLSWATDHAGKRKKYTYLLLSGLLIRAPESGSFPPQNHFRLFPPSLLGYLVSIT